MKKTLIVIFTAFFICALFISSVNAEQKLDINNKEIIKTLCLGFVSKSSFQIALDVYETSYCEVAKHYNHIHCGDDKLSMMVYADRIRDSLHSAIDNYIKIADCGGLDERDRQWFIEQYEKTGIETYNELLEFWEE